MKPLHVFVICLLCTSFVWGASTVKKAKRQKPNSLQDFAAMFKSNSSDGQQASAMQQATHTVQQVFGNASDVIKEGFRNIINQVDRGRVNVMKNLECPDGTKVFNVSHVSLKMVIQAARQIAPLLARPAGQSNSNQNRPPNNQGESGTSSEGLRLKPILCWNDTQEALEESLSAFTERQIARVLHPKILRFLSKEIADRVKAFLPVNASRVLCEELTEGDTADVLAVTRMFPCTDKLKQEACRKGSALRQALVQETRQQLTNSTSGNWTDVFDQFGNCIPPEILRRAPRDWIENRFAELFSADNAITLMARKNFSAADGAFVRSLGAKMCNISTARLLAIPTDSLTEGEASLACMKRDKDKVKKRKLAKKMLGSVNSQNCRNWLTRVDPTLEKCWKVMTAPGAPDIDLTALDLADLEQLPCDIVKAIKSKKQIGKVSSWTDDQLSEFQWMLRCMQSRDMDTDDVNRMADDMAANKLQVDGSKFSFPMKRKLLKKTKEKLLANGGTLDATKLEKLKPMVGAMTVTEVEELSADTVNGALPTMQKEFSQMGRLSRRKLIGKLTNAQLDTRLCELEEMAGDVPADKLEGMPDLAQTLLSRADCKFKCRGQEQCSAVFTKLAATLGGDWASAGRDFLDHVRDTGAMCGMPLDTVTELQPDTNFPDIAAAFFKAQCENPAMSQLFSDKLQLYMRFSAKRAMDSTDIQMFGANYFKKLSTSDLSNFTTDEKKSILESVGKGDLSDVDTQSIKDMAAAAVTAFAGKGSMDDVAVLHLGQLVCGVQNVHVTRMLPSALIEALPQFTQCPEASPATVQALRQAMRTTLNADYSAMDAADVSQGGVALLSDCANLDAIPDAAKSDAARDLADMAKSWREKREERRAKWRDPSSDDDSNQNEMQKNIRCGLRKLLEARPRVRSQEGTGQRRRKRSSGSYTCDDIRLLDEEAVILTEQDITGLSNADFDNCADVLGSVSEWSTSQKQALANKAKQVWGAVTTWPSSDVLLTAGTIVQGLTPQELSTMTLTLQHLKALGEHKNWTPEQMSTLFGGWLGSDSSVSGGVSSITSNHLQLLGYLVCGASPQQVSAITTQAYSGAMSEIGDAAKQCSVEQVQAWANLARQALGPVTTWSLTHTAAVDHVLAGLASADLSQLSSSQLSVMDLDTFAFISPQTFGSLTTDQLESVSTAHALVITPEQLSHMDSQQRAVLQGLGVSVVGDGDSAASEIPMTLSLLLTTVMATMVIMRE